MIEHPSIEHATWTYEPTGPYSINVIDTAHYEPTLLAEGIHDLNAAVAEIARDLPPWDNRFGYILDDRRRCLFFYESKGGRVKFMGCRCVFDHLYQYVADQLTVFEWELEAKGAFEGLA